MDCNDVLISYDSVTMGGVRIRDGAIISTRAVVTKDIEPYSIVGGVPAKEIRKTPRSTIASLCGVIG